MNGSPSYRFVALGDVKIGIYSDFPHSITFPWGSLGGKLKCYLFCISVKLWYFTLRKEQIEGV